MVVKTVRKRGESWNQYIGLSGFASHLYVSVDCIIQFLPCSVSFFGLNHNVEVNAFSDIQAGCLLRINEAAQRESLPYQPSGLSRRSGRHTVSDCSMR
jgi:hypothetical protein